MSKVDAMHYRNTVGNFPSGVTVVTTHHAGTDLGLTVSAFASLSLDPPMVLVSIDQHSKSHQYLNPGAPVGISVLASEHTDVAVQFGRHVPDRFAGIDINRDRNSVPLIGGAAAWFSGEVVDRYVGGDHIIVTIRVLECDFVEGVRPLLYQRGQLSEWPEVLG
jgi:hypothetical protein